jgi:hypothetical protein
MSRTWLQLGGVTIKRQLPPTAKSAGVVPLALENEEEVSAANYAHHLFEATTKSDEID